MKKIKSFPAIALSAAMVLALVGCEDSEPIQSSQPENSIASTTPATTPDPDENAATDEKAKVISSEDYTPDGNAGKVKYLGHYDLKGDQKTSQPYLIFNSDQYGGEIEYEVCPSGPDSLTALGTKIAADDSPDIVLYQWVSFPGGMSKGMYEPLDEYFDLDTALWKDMKTTVDDYAYKGKHYYYPFKIMCNFALNYNRHTFEEANLTDPYELYMEGNWTWDTWRDLMVKFCDLDDENIGYVSAADVIAAFVSTTGVNFVDVQMDGTATNNLGDPAVTRAMGFIEDCYRYGLMHQGQLGDWVSPETWAVNSDRCLFIGMEPEWCYNAATEKIQNPRGVENDVFDTVSDFAFVPFPRDPNADKYYHAYDTYGFMVPKGAKNIKGAVDWIYCNRVYETDVNVIAQAREDYIHPEVVTFVEGKFAGERKWTITWDEQVYDMLLELRNPAKFEFNFDDCYGFSTELSQTVIGNMLNDVAFRGESWAQLSNTNSPIVDGIISELK